jgi:hypothetical protein
MLNPLYDYPVVYRSIGGKQVITKADIPDANLCIGDAELQAPVPILYQYRGNNQSMKADVPWLVLLAIVLIIDVAPI